MDYFIKNRSRLQGNWSVATNSLDLVQQAQKLNPRFIFFPHWSEIVSSEIVNKYDCVCFHMTDVPYGRGGSPLQNLIIRGHSSTVITALKMNKDIDAGPVYLKRELDLSGSAKEIFERSVPICFDMMLQIHSEETLPVEQVGKPTMFNRRLPKDSEILENQSIVSLYDLIRMLDAPGYPAAFLKFGDLKIEFTDASITEDKVLNAKVKVIKYE